MPGTFPFLILWNPAVWAGAAAMVLLLRRSVAAGSRASWAFWAGMAALVAAFGTPIEVFSQHSLTAAMSQRLLTTGIAVPLLMVALAPPFWRAILGRNRGVFGILARPLVALVLFNGAYVVTAVPGVWDWLSTHPPAFWAQNVVFLALAVLFWWPVLSPLRESPRLHPLLSLAYLFVGGIALTPLFVFWSLVSHAPAYGVDAAGAHLLGLSALSDERVGGLVMKAGALVSYGVAFVAIFWRWWEEGQGRGGPRADSAPRDPVDLAEVRRRRTVKQESS